MHSIHGLRQTPMKTIDIVHEGSQWMLFVATLVAVCIFKGGPCVQMTWSLALIDVISDETLQDALFID